MHDPEMFKKLYERQNRSEKNYYYTQSTGTCRITYRRVIFDIFNEDYNAYYLAFLLDFILSDNLNRLYFHGNSTPGVDVASCGKSVEYSFF